MMNLLKWIAVAFLVVASVVVCDRACDYVFGQTPNCQSPMWPCALRQTNAQLTTVATPQPIPFSGLTGANQCVKTAYGTTLCRCTDVNSSTTSTLHSFEVSSSGASNTQEINADGTLVDILFATQGTMEAMQVDPIGHKCLGFVPHSQVSTAAAFDPTDKDLEYTVDGTLLSKLTGFHQAQGPTKTLIADLAKACPFSPPLTKVSSHSELSVYEGVVGIAFSASGQNTGNSVAAYRVSNGGCQTLNTLTGQFVAKGYGNSGPAKGANGFLTFTVHNLIIGPGGWANLGGPCPKCTPTGGDAEYLWQVGQVTMNLVTQRWGGHSASGTTSWTNLVNSPAMAVRKFSSVNTVSMMSSANGVSFPTPAETHCSWRNVNWNQTYPVICSQVSQNEQQPLVTKTPLEQEVYGVDPPTGTFLRLAPTLTSGLCNLPPAWNNFRTCNAIVVVAPLNAPPEIAFSSDGGGGFGNTDGVHPVCILGAATPNSCRSDVMIVFP